MRVTKNLMFGMMLVLAACTTNATDTFTSPGVALRVAFWDYTEDGISERPEIRLRGGDSWLPEMGHRFDEHTFSGLKLGTTETFIFDPFANDPLEIPVDFPITDQLCPSGCVSDTLHFEIRDDRISVWGVVESSFVYRLDRKDPGQHPPVQIRLIPES